MQWVIKVIPVSDGDWKSMIVGSRAAKVRRAGND